MFSKIYWSILYLHISLHWFGWAECEPLLLQICTVELQQSVSPVPTLWEQEQIFTCTLQCQKLLKLFNSTSDFRDRSYIIHMILVVCILKSHRNQICQVVSPCLLHSCCIKRVTLTQCVWGTLQIWLSVTHTHKHMLKSTQTCCVACTQWLPYLITYLWETCMRFMYYICFTFSHDVTANNWEKRYLCLTCFTQLFL